MVARNLAVLVIVTAITLSGCGGTEAPPPPTPSTGTTTTTSETPVPSEPPAVSDPVDLTPYARHPCTALTPQQVTDLGLPSERIEELSLELRDEIWQCRWSWKNSHKELPTKVGLYTFTVYPAGDPLGKAYQENSHRDERDTREFKARTVRGLPAVMRFAGEGDYGCEVVVGAGNGQGFTLWSGATSVADADMCPRLVAAAELVVDAVRR
jgi:hypothetical protein